ncbi:MAG: hypothetical protein EP330_04110 [Deltaproteobacteria bacterium]|nr:MAG: hypothetical protein EP330_04110 [Deltaproteobacteria bacterium]
MLDGLRRRVNHLYAIPAGAGMVFAGLNALFVFPRVAEDYQTLLRGEPIAESAEVGDMVWVGGELAANEVVVPKTTLVYAEKQQVIDGDWRVVDTAQAELTMKSGKHDVVITELINADVYGAVKTWDVDEQTRWVGYVRGTPLSLLGVVSATKPLTVEARDHFAGDRQTHIDERYGPILLASRLLGVAFIALGILVGLLGLVRALLGR